jgi:signal recognition particle protein
VVERSQESRRDSLVALHMAAGYVKPGVVKVLLELGADSEIQDDKGCASLDLAKEVLKVTLKETLFNLQGD